MGTEASPTCPDEPTATDSSSKLFHHIYDNFSVAAAKLLPSTVVMSSCNDQTIPWYSSTYFSQLLVKVGVQCRNLMYNHARHVDFVAHYSLRPPSHHPDKPANAAPALPAEDTPVTGEIFGN